MEIEQNLSDATVETSSESQDAQTDSGSQESAQAAPANKEASTPFHEHPRFKELIEEKNRYAEQAKAFDRQLRDMQSRLDQVAQPKQAPSESPLVQKLKSAGVDEEFVKWVSQQEKLMQDFQNVNQWKQGLEAQTVQQRAQTSFEKMCLEHKVTDEATKERYMAAVRHAASKDPSLQIEDLPRVFKQIHDAEQKYLDTLKRQAIADYTKGKTKDASVPPGAKLTSSASKQTKQAPKQSETRDPEELKAQFAKRVLDLARANRNA